jgi:hypothetical protein
MHLFISIIFLLEDILIHASASLSMNHIRTPGYTHPTSAQLERLMVLFAKDLGKLSETLHTDETGNGLNLVIDKGVDAMPGWVPKLTSPPSVHPQSPYAPTAAPMASTMPTFLAGE